MFPQFSETPTNSPFELGQSRLIQSFTSTYNCFERGGRPKGKASHQNRTFDVGFERGGRNKASHQNRTFEVFRRRRLSTPMWKSNLALPQGAALHGSPEFTRGAGRLVPGACALPREP